MFPLFGVISSLVPLVPAVLKLLGHSAEADKAGDFIATFEQSEFLDEVKKAASSTLESGGKGNLVSALDKAGSAQDQKNAEAALKAELENDPAIKQKLIDQLNAVANNALEEEKEKNRAAEEQQRIAIQRLTAEADTAQKERDDDRLAFEQTLKSQAEARTANIAAVQSGAIPAWFNPLLSLIIVMFFCFVIYHLMGPNSYLNEKNRDILNIVLGALGTAFATVISYHFGSSSGSKAKDATLKQALENRPPVDRPPPVDEQQRDPAQPVKDPPPVRPVSPPPSDKPTTRTVGSFDATAPVVMRDLMDDLKLSAEQSAGVLGNIGHECAGFRTMQEVKPLMGGRGGYGWCQWTGPRRRTFEAFATKHGFALDSYAANYGFLIAELTGDERGALNKLKATTTVESATNSFMKFYERPGVEALASRMKYAERALNAFKAS